MKATSRPASRTSSRRAGSGLRSSSAKRSAAPARKAPPALSIDVNRRLLNRYRFIEHESLHLLAGWLPKAETFELKCEIGRSL